jgi:hypothetical protein
VKAGDPLRAAVPAVLPPRPLRAAAGALARAEELEAPPEEDVDVGEAAGGFIGQANQGAGILADYGSVIDLSNQRRGRPWVRQVERIVESAKDPRAEEKAASQKQDQPTAQTATSAQSEALEDPSAPKNGLEETERPRDAKDVPASNERDERSWPGGKKRGDGDVDGQTGPESRRAESKADDKETPADESTGEVEPGEAAQEASEVMQDEADAALEEDRDNASDRSAAENSDARKRDAGTNARAAAASAAVTEARASASGNITDGAIAASPVQTGAAAGAVARPEAPAGTVAIPGLEGGGADLEGGDPAAAAEDMEARLEGAVEDESAEEVDPASMSESSIEVAIAENDEAAPQPAPELDEGGDPTELMSPLERDTAMGALAEEGTGAEYTGGGGGGGNPLKEETPVQPPDVSGLEPESGLAAIASLPPVALKKALGGVSSAVGRTAASEREGLRAAPPTMARPSGLPVGDQAANPAPAVAEAPARKAEPVPRGAEKPTPPALPLPPPAPLAAARVAAPSVAGTREGKVSAKDAARVKASLDDMPTTDPALDVDAGPTPDVALEASADPAQADAQRGVLAGSVMATHQAGLVDAAQDMGETRIHPVFPAETLSATIPPGAESTASASSQLGASVGSEDEQALSIIAQQERGSEINGAIAAASAGMVQKRSEYTATVEGEKSTNATEMAAVVEATTSEQEGLRTQARADVTVARESWSQEQGDLVATSNTDADKAVAEGHQDVLDQASAANAAAEAKMQEGEAKADVERGKAESDAENKKTAAKKESKGIFGWLASEVTSFFNDLKNALSKVFESARKLIREAIELAKSLAVAVIEAARKVIVTIIDGIGKALILIGDTLLAAFPVLREKWRSFITEKVENAKAEVNAAADRLKARAQELLDKLAAGLEKAIGWLEKGLNTLLDGVASAIDSALKFAESMVEMLGVFATLITDVATDPIGWIKNLGSSIVDGITNHLWGALKTAIQEWFNSKLEEVLGLGLTVWNVLKEGGFSLEAIGKLAWEGIKAMVPQVLMETLIEQLAAMIVPAVGAVMAIINGIRAGWGAIKRIIAAIDTFVAFLKQVKQGGAGPHFARALAAAAVAVIDFVANWLLVKLAKGAGKIAGKIKGIAQRLFKKIKKFFRKRKRSKLRPQRKPKSRKKDKDKKKDRLEKAVKAIQPQVAKLLKKGVSKLRLRATLAFYKLRYRLSSLSLKGTSIVATINPSMPVDDAYSIEDHVLGGLMAPIYEAAATEVLALVRQMELQKPVKESLEKGDGIPDNTPAPVAIAAMQELLPGKVKLEPRVELSANGDMGHTAAIQGEVKPGGSYAGFAEERAKALALPPGQREAALAKLAAKMPGMQALSSLVEPARNPATAIPLLMKQDMDIADPLHPDLDKDTQHHGGAPKTAKDATPVTGVQNPPAPKGSGGTTMDGGAAKPKKKTKKVQAHIIFATGVITRMVMEAAKGKEMYAHNGMIPKEVTDAMHKFVKLASVHLRKSITEAQKQDDMAGDAKLQALKAELKLQLKAFFAIL